MNNRMAGRKIAKMRQARGLTQQQLAAMMNVSHQAVSKWESGLALPDIQTMLELMRFFGITVEQLFADEELTETETPVVEEKISEVEPEMTCEPEKEDVYMNIQQLLQMAPFMSKPAVEEIALQIEDKITAAQLARLAPFVSGEVITALIEKHKPQFSWDSLRKLAPFMGREAVDALARSIASGNETVKPAGENINKTFSDLGKAFDNFGKDMGQAFDGIGRKAKKGVKKAIRFGGKVINEVSSAINDLAEEEKPVRPAGERSEKAVAIRKKAFERALDDGRWDWIALHLTEIENDAELKAKIADRARELDMHDWICEHMGGYADESTVRAAIDSGNWEWLGDNAWQLDNDMQHRVALAAMRTENWEWLEDFSEQMDLKECGMEIAQNALRAGEKHLSARIANVHLTQPEAAALAREACAMQDYDAFALLVDAAGKDYLNHALIEFAERGEWEFVARFAEKAEAQTVEKLMDMAVDAGNFDAIDQLDAFL